MRGREITSDRGWSTPDGRLPRVQIQQYKSAHMFRSVKGARSINYGNLFDC